ncbi:MAG: NapC/NirT family cytochrome c [Candidatus Zixiibacteriota bacterium]|jgi:hypothetical protein
MPIKPVVSRRTLFSHPLAALGGALVLVGGLLFIGLILVDLASATSNPYRSLVTFVAVPFLITVGVVLFLVSIWVQVRNARKKGEKVRFTLSIEPSDPKYMRNLWLFLGITVGLILLVTYSGYQAYEATDSVAFCGQTCHKVMAPQEVTYHNSPHARVPCVECHIGPGASFWVKSKVDGLRQVIATVFNTYDRPIKTPVHSLRPAQQTCEKCHWPQKFYGNNLLTKTYYRTDETNSPWTIQLSVKIGGGNPRTGKLEGIHWHMLTADKIDYIATDEKRQNIAWVQATDLAGKVTTYTRSGEEMPDTSKPDINIRQFDCIDCHNRPSHKFLAPATAINLALSARRISPDLPYIRNEGLNLINAEYTSREEAVDSITAGLARYYNENYPQLADSMADDINQATETLVQIYNENFFPIMKTDYRVRENNLSHFVNDGCFRCHDGEMADQNGRKIPHDCKTCHLIIAQGPSELVDSLQQDVAGLEFHHPEDIEGMWKEMKCTDCHTPDSGY